jgi:uncharacterized membrane protein
MVKNPQEMLLSHVVDLASALNVCALRKLLLLVVLQLVLVMVQLPFSFLALAAHPATYLAHTAI